MERHPIRELISRATAYMTGAGLGPILVRSITGTGLVRLLAMVASFCVGVQLARCLGAAGYGYYGMALAVITLAGVPGELGLPRLVTREVAAAMARKNLPAVFGVLRWADSMSLRISLPMMIAVAAASVVVARIYQPTLATALLLGAPMIPLLTLTRIRDGSLQGLHFIVRGQIPEILARPVLLSLLILAFSLAHARLTPGAAMALGSITAASVFILAHSWLKRRLPPRPSEVVRNGRQWLASSVPIGLTDAMRVLQSEASVLLLGIIASPSDVGLFRIAIVTSFTAATPVAMVSFVAFPIIARLHAEQDRERLQRVLTRLAQAQFAGVAVLCAPLFLVPGLLLKFVFGAEYEGAADALRILAAAHLITAALGLSWALLNMAHQERRVTRAMAIALTLNVVALPLLAIMWGLMGAAIAVAAGLILWSLLTWADSWRLLGLETSVLPSAWIRRFRRR